MKNLLILFLITIAFCLNGFAQKKPVRKTGTASASKKTASPSPSAYKSGPIDETTFFMTIEHNGEKTEVKSSQFQTHGGTTMPDGSVPDRLLLSYGASNNNDDKNFSFQGWIPVAAKGIYEISNGGKAGFSLMTSLFPNVPIFLVKGGTYEITAMPLNGGFVEGTFTVVCENITNEGKVETYNINGSFKILSQ